MAGGAALGGVLVAALGAGMTLMVDAISFGASAILVMSLRPRAQTRPEKASFIEDLALGLKEFIKHTWLWVIVIKACACSSRALVSLAPKERYGSRCARLATLPIFGSKMASVKRRTISCSLSTNVSPRASTRLT